MIELGTGFHPELTGEENVLLNTSIHGLSRSESLDIYDAVVDYSGLRHFMDVPLKNYSSGMHMRLGFAIAAKLDPDVLLLDEIFAVGDEDFQKQCMATVAVVPGARQDDRLRLALVDGGPGGLPSRVRARPRTAPLRWTGRCRPDRIPPDDGGLPARSHRPPRDRCRTRSSQRTTDDDPELSWHRLATGGRWNEEGAWVFDFLRRQGLEPDHFVLEVGCGSLSAASRLLPYMRPNHYWGFEKNIELFIAGSQIELPRAGVRPELGQFMVNDDFDFSLASHPFDLAIAGSLFRRLPLNSIARCLAAVVRRLAPGGRFYATWPDNPDPRDFEPIAAARRHSHLQRPRALSLQLRDPVGRRRSRRRPRRTAATTTRTRAASPSW